jgi:transposase-like protein
MPRKKHTPEQVINKLREAEVVLAQGRTVAEASRQTGVTEQTFYRWRNEYGGLRMDCRPSAIMGHLRGVENPRV